MTRSSPRFASPPSPVSRHKNFLVFHRSIVDLRVLHGTRDLPSTLTDNLNFGEDSEAGKFYETRTH